MKKMMVLLSLTMAFQQASALSITTDTGLEISGFSDKGFSNPDFQRTQKDPEIFKGKSENRELKIYSTPKGQHVYYQDTTFPSVKDMTSTIIEEGKVKSQLNCLALGSAGPTCYAITKEVCEAVLRESGKPSLREFQAAVNDCDKVLNVYHRAISKSGDVRNSIIAAYKEHSALKAKEDPSLSTAALTFFGKAPKFNTSGTVEHDKDIRIDGMINNCSSYLAKNTLAASNFGPPRPVQNSAPAKTAQ